MDERARFAIEGECFGLPFAGLRRHYQLSRSRSIWAGTDGAGTFRVNGGSRMTKVVTDSAIDADHVKCAPPPLVRVAGETSPLLPRSNRPHGAGKGVPGVESLRIRAAEWPRSRFQRCWVFFDVGLRCTAVLVQWLAETMCLDRPCNEYAKGIASWRTGQQLQQSADR
jgi:hypothetical protein